MATLIVKGLPNNLYEKLKVRAERDCRSVSEVVVRLLYAAMDEPRQLSILELQGLGKELWRGGRPSCARRG